MSIPMRSRQANYPLPAWITSRLAYLPPQREERTSYWAVKDLADPKKDLPQRYSVKLTYFDLASEQVQQLTYELDFAAIKWRVGRGQPPGDTPEQSLQAIARATQRMRK